MQAGREDTKRMSAWLIGDEILLVRGWHSVFDWYARHVM
jgi:hypothetical protein